MRRLVLSLAAAATIGLGVASAGPASAHDFGFYPPRYAASYYDHDGWRERAWREHEWREHEMWAWRHHMWREHQFDH